jgi:hypothetical protein
MKMYNNILVTATNSPYYSSLLTLISGVHKHSLDIVDKIFVFNLGLEETEVNYLNTLKNVEVLNFPSNTADLHSKFLEPKSYVYKIYCMKMGSVMGHNVLWLDSGACPLKSIKEIYDKINTEDVFLVGDVHINKNFTHSDCVKCLSATENELSDNQLWAGLVGYKSNGKYQQLFDDAYSFSLIEGCLDGNQENHRHDQSILSILASRYGCPKHDIDIYGYWTDSSRNLDSAKSIGSVIFAHRRGYDDKSGLISKD